MSFVGKVLIVVQVIMSICFMAFAGAVFATHANWKAEHDKVTASLVDEQAQVQTLRQEKEAAAASQDVALKAAQNRAETAEKDVLTVSTERDSLKSKTDQLERELQTQTAVAISKAAEAGFRRDEAIKYRDLNKALQATVDEKTGQIRTLEDEVFSQDLQHEELLAQYNDLLKQKAFLERLARINNLETDPRRVMAMQEPPPPVEGLVVEVRRDSTNRPKYVEISIGSDDGLVENHTLDVYRTAARSDTGKSRYLGKIRVVSVWTDRAVCLVVDAAKNGIIERGDNVTTKL